MTARLGDSFPSEFREDFCDRCLVRGAVLRARVEETIPPKIKLFVIWGSDKTTHQLAVSFINSKMTSIRWLQTLEHPLLVSNNSFLIHDSFLECHRIYEKDLTKIRELLKAESEIFLGNLSPADLSAAERMISAAKTIEPKLKRKYGFI